MNKAIVITRSRLPKKQQIVEAAFNLFKASGFHATGVDLIMQTAKVSKRTMYRYFPTKNDLILAVLEHYRTTYTEHVNEILGQPDKTSREKILAVFDDAKQWFNDTNFRGCLAVNAMGEFSGKNQAIENSCMRFKRWEIELLQILTKDINPHKSDELACKLFVLLEGMSSIAQVTKGTYPIDMTMMANEIIENHYSAKI